MLQDDILEEIGRVMDIMREENKDEVKENERLKKQSIQEKHDELSRFIEAIPSKAFQELAESIYEFLLKDAHSVGMYAFFENHLHMTKPELEKWMKHEFSLVQQYELMDEFEERINTLSLSVAEKGIMRHLLSFFLFIGNEDVLVRALHLSLSLVEEDMHDARQLDPVVFFSKYRKSNVCQYNEDTLNKVLKLFHDWYQRKGKEVYDLEHHPSFDDPETGIDAFADLSYLFDEAFVNEKRKVYLQQVEQEFNELKENTSLSTKEKYHRLFDLHNQARRANGEY